MADVRFTRDLISKIGDVAREVTGGAFVLGATGADIGNGPRFINGKSQIVWVGTHGAREAAAYYIGGILEFVKVKGDEVPEDLMWLRDVQDAYRGKQRYRNWEEQGREHARADIRKEG